MRGRRVTARPAARPAALQQRVATGVVPLPGGSVVLGPRITPLVRAMCLASLRSARRDGISPPAAVVELLDGLDAAAAVDGETSADGSAELPRGAGLAASIVLDPITTQEAAVLLRSTARNVRDLRDRGHLPSSRWNGRAWLLDRAEVEELRAARRADERRTT